MVGKKNEKTEIFGRMVREVYVQYLVLDLRLHSAQKGSIVASASQLWTENLFLRHGLDLVGQADRSLICSI